jgi:hypothetical protein
MGLFSRAPQQPTKPALRLPADTRMIDVRGESHYVPALERVARENGVDLKHRDEFDLDDVWLRIIPQPTNPHDSNAIMVASPRGDCLGHISREGAAKYVEVISELAEKHELWCKAQMGGGIYDGDWRIGVWIYIPTPGELGKLASLHAAASIAVLAKKWQDAQALQAEASQILDTTIARMRANGEDCDGEHTLLARANLEKAIRAHVRAIKALHRAVTDFQGRP